MLNYEKRPDYVRLGETALIKSGPNEYYRPAGCWKIEDEFFFQVHQVSPNVVWQLKHAVGKPLIEITREEFLADNHGYVSLGYSPWVPEDDIKKETEEDEDIPF